METAFQLLVKVQIGLTESVERLLLKLLDNTKSEAPAAIEAAAPAAPASTEAPAPAPAPASGDVPTPADVRAAINNAFARVMGDDWKDAESPMRKKYHNTLKGIVQNICTGLGVTKSAELAPGQRQAFIDACAEIALGDDGKVKVISPF